MKSNPYTTYDPNCEPTDLGIFGLPHLTNEAALILIPVPWEATVSYGRGTSRAPRGILAASRQVELHDVDTGRPYERGIAMVPDAAPLHDLHQKAIQARCRGDARAVDSAAIEMHRQVEQETRLWRERRKVVAILGGEHGTSLGAIRAISDDFDEIGVLQVDAHPDLRESYQGMRYSHACLASNLLREVPQVKRLVQVGIRDCCPADIDRIGQDDRIVTWFDAPLSDPTILQVIHHLPKHVWVSVDIDGLDPALCPATGTPVPGGLQWREMLALLAAVRRGGRQIIGFDLSEVVPSGNHGEGWDEIVAARLLYKLCGWTLWNDTECR